ncbi:CoA transferase [Streptomyces gamaensis]|uniref:CoA transferase n=1 Tax=Streptomyces gamaensis TaxID=1763542 RepID=A0ABW0YRX1_9ACTN
MIKRATAPTAHAWAALGGDPAHLGAVEYGGPGAGVLPARLPVREMARASVAVCALAAAELAAVRSGKPLPAVSVDDGAVATAFVSERHLRIDDRAATTFAPLSRFWRAVDGWVRTHANYPHHRERLLAALRIPDDGSDEALVDRVARVLAERPASDIEDAVYAADGLAVAVRTPQQWAAHPQGLAVAQRPLLTLDRIADDGPTRDAGISPEPGLPAKGLRVLDLTRVIAGPVATRTLALLGADVLRVDSPRLPEFQDAHNDTGFGKRSTVLDLDDTADRATFHELLATAHVVVTGYRPGALDRHGLVPEALAERHPGLVVAQLSAWGDYGPWGGRRGFDSLVQAAVGIAVTEAHDDGTPGVLPAQALDHGTGYLLAAAVLRALTEQRTHGGGTRLARPALAQTACWLTTATGRDTGDGGDPYSPDPHLTEAEIEVDGEADGLPSRIRYALPPVSFAGGPRDWARTPGRLGTDPATWA